MEGPGRDRSSSEDSFNQLFFAQLALNELFQDEPHIGGGSKTFQTKIRYRVLHGLTPENAFRNRDGFRCRSSRHLLDQYTIIGSPICEFMLLRECH
jgi:hypothetical protein